MSDSISRTDAIRWVKTECNPYGKPTLDYDSGLRVIEHLKNMPSALPSAKAVEAIHDTEWVALRLNEYEDLLASAEVAQVVLCKNCRFYDNLCAVCRCPQWDLSRTEYPKVKENDFCSYGEASDED